MVTGNNFFIRVILVDWDYTGNFLDN